jgi:hypothetical protein
VHELPATALANVDGDSTHVRVQVLTNAGALDREKQIALVAKLGATPAPKKNSSQPRALRSPSCRPETPERRCNR